MASSQAHSRGSSSKAAASPSASSSPSSHIISSPSQLLRSPSMLLQSPTMPMSPLSPSGSIAASPQKKERIGTWDQVEYIRTQKRIHGRIFKNTPPPINSFTMNAIDGGKKIVVICGMSDEGPRSEAWFFSRDTGKWNVFMHVDPESDGSPQDVERQSSSLFSSGSGLKPVNSTPSPASSSSSSLLSSSSSLKLSTNHYITPRCGHSACVFRSRPEEILVFGGSNTSSMEYYNDLWLLKTSPPTWEKLTPSGPVPSPRWHATVVEFEDRMFLYGGEGASYQTLGDMHVYSREANSWLSLRAIQSSPPPRQLHSAVVVGPKLIIIGGIGARGPLCDMWSFDLRSMIWKQLEWHGPSPFDKDGGGQASLSGHSSVALDDRYVLVHGGRVGDTTTANAWIYDLLAQQWSTLPYLMIDDPPRCPTQRWKHKGLLIDDRHVMLFGGIGPAKRTDDLWSFHINL